MIRINTRSYCLALLGVSACAGGVGSAGARAAAPATPAEAPTRVAKSEPALAPLEYHDESDSDHVFVQNAERAIREYQEFIARAGESPEYAQAVKRSREQIQDLQATLVFIREGAAQRP